MIEKIRKWFEQFDFWFSHHKELQCNHYCMGCEYYNDCLDEVFETWCDVNNFKIGGQNGR